METGCLIVRITICCLLTSARLGCQVQVHGLSGLKVLDNTANMAESTETGDRLSIPGEVDRIFVNTPSQLKVLPCSLPYLHCGQPTCMPPNIRGREHRERRPAVHPRGGGPHLHEHALTARGAYPSALRLSCSQLICMHASQGQTSFQSSGACVWPLDYAGCRGGHTSHKRSDAAVHVSSKLESGHFSQKLAHMLLD